MKNFRRFLYGWFFIIIPFVNVTGFIAWEYFISNDPIGQSITDILSILAICYFFGSIFWYFNMGRVENVANQFREEER
ncbi:hypothetical protein [Halobacillus amylolyticus]|uniref:DUF485 domain-containing protein n=1 Tax=Halobacillus amylolyticus TaxID=2932259 RepID=A0ABY4HHJ5_9BACI|nr:hypothetical protein [Halobacillus amylolyticus]UOR12905.1 hypothetical protein MUO15_05200 [Halobacillus amylolyticus]